MDYVDAYWRSSSGISQPTRWLSSASVHRFSAPLRPPLFVHSINQYRIYFYSVVSICLSYPQHAEVVERRRNNPRDRLQIRPILITKAVESVWLACSFWPMPCSPQLYCLVYGTRDVIMHFTCGKWLVFSRCTLYMLGCMREEALDRGYYHCLYSVVCTGTSHLSQVRLHGPDCSIRPYIIGTEFMTVYSFDNRRIKPNAIVHCFYHGIQMFFGTQRP